MKVLNWIATILVIETTEVDMVVPRSILNGNHGFLLCIGNTSPIHSCLLRSCEPRCMKHVLLKAMVLVLVNTLNKTGKRATT